jgi:phage anti-repressor protein
LAEWNPAILRNPADLSLALELKKKFQWISRRVCNEYIRKEKIQWNPVEIFTQKSHPKVFFFFGWIFFGWI